MGSMIMRYALAVIVSMLTASPLSAQQVTCRLQAIEKKLTGTALSTFMEKCGDDAQKTCEQLATARRLEEPNRTLFLANCVKAFLG
jgi:hypothetical protein